MITYLIEALQAAGLAPTAEELADLLWLASHMGTPTFVKAETALANRQPRPNPTLPRMDDTQPAEDDDQKKSAVQTTSEENTQTGADVYLPPTGNESWDETGNGGLPFRSPGATGLPGALDIGRALRPLKRRVPARTQFVLDEEATVRRIVDMNMDNWLPVMRPAPARWLDVVLVVDEASSMVLWRQTIAELRRLLEQLGAFRTIQTWHILPDVAIGQVFLSPDLRMSKARIDQRSAAELRDPCGQRLILVLSDCVAPYWYNGEIARWLEQWGQDGLVAIVHMLPQQLRLRTGLASATAVYVRSHLPGLHNAQLAIKWPRRRRRNQSIPVGIPIPVVTLESETLGPWARLLTGNGKQWLPAVVFPQSQTTDFYQNDIQRADLSEQLPPEKLVEQFLATASPLARELAGYFAAVPLSLPVMRLVQRVMLPQSRQVHLAEVLLSGLIRQTTTHDPAMLSDDIRYDFIKGNRDLLLDTVLTSDIELVLTAVSRYMGEHIGQTIDFKAWLTDPASIQQLPLNTELRAFATILAHVLTRLGGRYALLAKNLQQRTNIANNKSTIKIITRGGHQVLLDDARHTITIISSSGNKVVLDASSNKIVLDSRGSLDIKSHQKLKIISRGNINFQTDGQANIKGAIVNLNGGQPVAKQGDRVVAIDIHIVMVPSPSGPIPTPLPHPFNGVIDSNVSPNVRVHGLPIATVGSTATNTPPHIPCPPGNSFQVAPTNTGVIITGSTTVMVNGKSATRNGDQVQTCSDPTPNVAGKVVAAATVNVSS